MSFDVFFCYNHKNKAIAKRVGETLLERGLKVWLDDWELPPGKPWISELENIIASTRSAAVLVGAEGLGAWSRAEMEACINHFHQRQLPVIPVLLPGGPEETELPIFLRSFGWVDLREGLTEEGIERLECGIRGRKPGSKRAPQPPRDSVFISCCRQDRELLKKLTTMLAPLVQTGSILTWDPTQIVSGDHPQQAPLAALAKAKAAVLLVSGNYLADPRIREEELPAIHEAALLKELRLLWIAAGPCLHEETVLQQYVPLNDSERPLKTMKPPQQEQALTEICRTIRDVVNG